MYAVIFKAELNTDQLAHDYLDTAKKMRELAEQHYNCINFISIMEGQQEISISYWHSLKDIQQWKQNAEHLSAQQHGKHKWYQSYYVQIVEVIKEYRG